MGKFQFVAEAIQQGQTPQDNAQVKVYPLSVSSANGTSLVMVKDKEQDSKYLIAVGEGPLFDELEGEVEGGYKAAPLSHANRLVLNKYFDYTVPRAFGTQIATIGLGDRLGIASPGHIQTVRGRNVRPILAQQSIRELNLTGRDYKQVVDAACFMTFRKATRTASVPTATT